MKPLQLQTHFPFQPTEQQANTFGALAGYFSDTSAHHVFVLKGAAGTGKTALLQAVAKALQAAGRRVVLLAPTGRAAKIASRRSNLRASTLHLEIYSSGVSTGGSYFALKENHHPKETVFIVDEASMLGDTAGEGTSGQGLLRDFLRYVWRHNPKGRVLLIGDPAQLPPVGTQRSPALDVNYLRGVLQLKVTSANLTAVKRQALHSGILYNATALRKSLSGQLPQTWPPLFTAPDVKPLPDAESAMDTFLTHFEPDNPESVVLLTHSNAIAAQFNEAVRQRLFYEPEEITEGDWVMAVKNYYFHDGQRVRFIANGETGVVRRVLRDTRHAAAGQEWLSVELEFPTGEQDLVSLQATIPLDLLYSKSPNLGDPERFGQLHTRRENLLKESPGNLQDVLRQDAYLNSLQLKMGYAVTGHKAQGGQWNNVIIAFEPWFFRTQDNDGEARSLLEPLRWTYTAVTRAASQLYLLQPPFPLQELPL